MAAAFLAGEWDPPAMGRRAKRALGDRRHWPTELARIVRHQYPERPADRPRELAGFIAACGPFARAFSDPKRPLRIHIWMAATAAMGPAPWPVPPIADLTALAGWLGVTAGHLDWFADRRSLERRASDERLRHYHRRWVRKPDGSLRLLEAPKRELKDPQRQVLHRILDSIPAHPAAHGFRPGRSVLTGAAAHAGQDVLGRLDLDSDTRSSSSSRPRPKKGVSATGRFWRCTLKVRSGGNSEGSSGWVTWKIRSGRARSASRCSPRSVRATSAGRSDPISSAAAREQRIWPPEPLPRRRATRLRGGPK